MHPIRKLLSEIVSHRAGTGPIKSLTNESLLAEWHYWNDEIKNATSWGASLSAANEFRTECERELTRRNISIPTR